MNMIYAKLTNGALEILPSDINLETIKNAYLNKLSTFNVRDIDLMPILQKTENKRSAEELKKIVARKLLDDAYKQEIENFNSYKRCVVKDVDLGEFDSYVPQYEETENEIIVTYQIIKNDANKINEKISELKQELADSDWKVVRCYEASLIKKEMPYDIKELSEYREFIRNKIRQLQELL